jgi:hypothetical protein
MPRGDGNFGDIIRSIRRSGTSADAGSVRELLDRAWAERVASSTPPTPAEVTEVQTLLDSPDLRDNFSPKLKSDLESFVRGSNPAKTVPDLVPDLDRLQQPREVPARFAADYVLVREQLLDRPGLTASEKANRAWEYFSKYAERFVTLIDQGSSLGQNAHSDADTHGGSFSQADRSSETVKFLDSLKQFGFLDLVEGRTGMDGLQAAKEILNAKNAQELARRASFKTFDAPAWEAPKQPQVSANYAPSAGEKQAISSGLLPKVPIQELGQSGPVRERRSELDAINGRSDMMRVNQNAADAAKIVVRTPDKRTVAGESTGLLGKVRNKVLGPNMLWNILHRYREGADADEEGHLGKDPMDKLAFGAVLLLLGLALAAIAVVTL